jgi:hypothetical protein
MHRSVANALIFSDPSDRPTADTLLRHSTFCIRDLHYNFYDTDLWAKLRTVEAAALPQD